MLIKGDIPEEVEKLKRQDGKDIPVFSSSRATAGKTLITMVQRGFPSDELRWSL